MIFCLSGRKKVGSLIGIKNKAFDYGPYIGGSSVNVYAKFLCL